MASNHMPDYVSTGRNISRRIIPFRFDRVVEVRKPELEARIISEELANAAARFLGAYKRLRDRLGTTGDLWTVVPDPVRRWSRSLESATNQLHRFLDMDEDQRGFSVTRSEGKVTWLEDLRNPFNSCPETQGSFQKDATVLARFGFSVSDGRVNVCKTCKQMFWRSSCTCPELRRDRKANKEVVFNMVIGAIQEDDEL